MQPQTNPKRSGGLGRKIILSGIILVVVAGGVIFWKSAHTLTIVSANLEGFEVGTGYSNFVLEKEDTRTDVLLLGMRGADDPNGGLLVDTILLASYDEQTGVSALVSIPRDLYVDLPGHRKKEKINAVYAVGEQQAPGGGGLALSKQVLSYVLGVYIDHAIVVNFDAFTDLVAMLDGVTIERTTVFREDKQWRFEGREGSPYWHIEVDESGEEGWVFEIPKGIHVLDEEAVLYYVRSRYSTSDFDRMARQQEILAAIGDKVLSLGVLANPIRVYELLDIAGNNLETDVPLVTMRLYIDLLRKDIWKDSSTYVLDNSPEGLLVEDNQDGQYVLLPKAGHFNDMRDFFQTMLNR